MQTGGAEEWTPDWIWEKTCESFEKALDPECMHLEDDCIMALPVYVALGGCVLILLSGVAMCLCSDPEREDRRDRARTAREPLVITPTTPKGSCYLCPARHPLSKFATPKSLKPCALCQRPLTDQIMWGCRRCKWGICGTCLPFCEASAIELGEAPRPKTKREGPRRSNKSIMFAGDDPAPVPTSGSTVPEIQIKLTLRDVKEHGDSLMEWFDRRLVDEARFYGHEATAQELEKHMSVKDAMGNTHDSYDALEKLTPDMFPLLFTYKLTEEARRTPGNQKNVKNVERQQSRASLVTGIQKTVSCSDFSSRLAMEDRHRQQSEEIDANLRALSNMLKTAVQSEDYKEAAHLKTKIEALQAKQSELDGKLSSAMADKNRGSTEKRADYDNVRRRMNRASLVSTNSCKEDLQQGLGELLEDREKVRKAIKAAIAAEDFGQAQILKELENELNKRIAIVQDACKAALTGYCR